MRVSLTALVLSKSFENQTILSKEHQEPAVMIVSIINELDSMLLLTSDDMNANTETLPAILPAFVTVAS